MIVLNYSKYDVLDIFHQLNPATLNPSARDIQDFDEDLFQDNESILLKIMAEEGLATTKSLKSTILLLSQQGPTGAQQRIRNACRYYKNTLPL
ncbi:MAG: hypothetical protein WDO18_21115 [Acidobacteriota bacterium]